MPVNVKAGGGSKRTKENHSSVNDWHRLIGADEAARGEALRQRGYTYSPSMLDGIDSGEGLHSPSRRSKQKGRHYQVDEQNSANWVKQKSDRMLVVSDDEPMFPTAEGDTTIGRARDFTWKLFREA